MYEQQDQAISPPVAQAVQQRKLRPGRIWYLVALVIFAAAAAWLIYSVFSFAGTVNGLQRVPLPAGGTVNLGHDGGFVVYYEGPGAESGNIPSFNIRVTPASHGASVTGLARYGSSVTYSVGSHQGRAVLTLDIARPGTFAISASGAPPAGSDLAIGGSMARGIVGIIVPGVPLMILAFLGGLLVFIIRVVRKSAMRRAQQPNSLRALIYLSPQVRALPDRPECLRCVSSRPRPLPSAGIQLDAPE